MRCRVLIIMLAVFLVALCSIAPQAQIKEEKAQLLLVEEVKVNPSMLTQYEAHAREAINLFTKHNFHYPFLAYMTYELCYYYAFPLENLADINNLDKAFIEVAKKAGNEQWQAMMKSAEGAFEYSKYFMLHYAPELSYIPENPRLKPGEERIANLEICYIQIGKEKEFEELCKKVNEVHKNNNIPDGWQAYVGGIGTETPMYVFVHFAKNIIDYYTQLTKNHELMGEEYINLAEKELTTIRKIELKNCNIRPDLSYIPKKEQPTE